MTLAIAPQTEIGRKAVRLDTLVRIRWLAVAGQSAAVLGVRFGLGFEFPASLCFLLIACSALVNVVLKVRYPGNIRLTETSAVWLLGYDIVQLTGLLFLTGGLGNPISFLLLAPVMVSATVLPPGKTLVLGGVAALAATGLAMWHWPLPWHGETRPAFPVLYVASVWVALLLSLAFMGVYAFRVADEARKLADALLATELVMAREQHLSALDGLAAAAAHELGTPLATIALVSKELEREVPRESEWFEDIQLLRSQSERCRSILAKLRSLSGESGHPFARMSIRELIEEVVDPHRDLGVAIDVRLPEGNGKAPVGARSPTVLYGLGNLLENAVAFADSRVVVGAGWTDDLVTVTIDDDGPGFAPDVIDRIGEPYVSTRFRSARREAGGRADTRDLAGVTGGRGGLGLGVFIAKTLLERSGAELEFGNRRGPDHGASVVISWKRSDFDLPKPEEEPEIPEPAVDSAFPIIR